MNKQSNGSKTAASLCLELAEDDGIASCYLMEKSKRKSASHKALQLCKELSHIASTVLMDVVDQPLLCGLEIVSVMPERDEQLLRISVGHCGVEVDVSEKVLLEALKPLRGILRYKLAQAVNRKRVPEIGFRYVGLISQGAVYAD